MLTRPDLTTLFEDLRHLIDVLDSADLTVAESSVLLPQVCHVIGTIHGADAMGPGDDPESGAREGKRFVGDQAHAAIEKAPSELSERSFA
jgi:hypothetical protein